MEEMVQAIEKLYANDGKELRKLCHKEMAKFGGISQMEFDNFYSRAGLELSVIKHKYENTELNLPDGKTVMDFLCGAIKYSIWKEMTDKNRQKRQNIIEKEVIDENGDVRIIKEYLHNISIDAPIGDNESSTIGDMLQSDFKMDDDVIDDTDDKVERCLSELPIIQKKIIELKMKDVSVENIKRQLNLSNSEYENHMKAIRENRAIIDFKTKRKNIMKKAEGKIMSKAVDEKAIQVMDIDTTDSYRRDNNTLGSLLDDISDELSPTYINRDYISQRQPFMWTEEQINKFYARILNNQPIPEIIICEQVVNGRKVSFLIDGLQRLSYAELFKSNARAIKAKGAEFTNIKYRKRIVDEDGNIQVVEEIFDIVGKKYKDLPEFLQKRFDSFNVTVTRFFNCTSEMIDYHIRNYNSHTAMNKVQYGATNASNVTVRNIKELSQKHSFFKNIVKINNKNVKDGSWDEVVGRSIMATYFLDDWKREVKDVFVFLDENSTAEQFECLKGHLDRLVELAKYNSLKELFTTGNTHIWLAVYDKFSKLGLEDSKFVDFMKKFVNDLHMEETTDFIKDVYKSRQNRDKAIVVGKIEGLYELLLEYLGINKEDTEDVDCAEFVKSNVEDTTDEDIEFYEELLDDLTLNVDNNSRLLDKHNRPSLLALVGYSVKNDIDLDEWIIDFFKNNTTYILNQTENYKMMVNSLQKRKVA